MVETMPAELAENLIDFCENRSRVYALLSRCYETEIDAAFADALAGEAALASDDAELAAGFAALQADLADCERTRWNSWPWCSTARSSAWARALRRRPSRTSRCTRARAAS